MSVIVLLLTRELAPFLSMSCTLCTAVRGHLRRELDGASVRAVPVGSEVPYSLVTCHPRLVYAMAHDHDKAMGTLKLSRRRPSSVPETTSRIENY